MPQSLARIVLHIVFSTKRRTPFLKDPEVRSRLYAYMAVVLQGVECEPILINGTEDHIHILCNFSRKITVAALIETVKTGPSKWIKEQGTRYEEFYWQGGYGAFSISQPDVEIERRYIAGQEEHHRHVSFQEEFREMCRKHGIEIDERYAWD
jgi:REP element-mobilizing transposase RayT